LKLFLYIYFKIQYMYENECLKHFTVGGREILHSFAPRAQGGHKAPRGAAFWQRRAQWQKWMP